MKTKKVILAFLISMSSFCSVLSQDNNSLDYKEGKVNKVYLRGTINCQSGEIAYQNNEKNVDIKFNKDLCSIFKRELESVGDEVRWLINWSKFKGEFLPRSSSFNIYENEVLKSKWSISFVTGPSYKNEEKFKKSLYYKISQVRPILMNSQIDSIFKIEIFLTLVKK